MTEKKKRNSATKSEEKITRNIRKNLKEKQLLYSKKEKRKSVNISSTRQIHAKF
jgi:hypothetical protein